MTRSKWSMQNNIFLPQSGYEASQTSDYEIYIEKGQEGLFCELWIPVKK